MQLDTEIRNELTRKGAGFVHFVDVSKLSFKQNRKYKNAVLFGIALSASYIKLVAKTPDFVQKLRENNQLEKDEFHIIELKTDKLADYLANFINTLGYEAYSQSEANLISTGFYNVQKQSSSLPHKTIAGLAGIGWIGKNNLLITREYGCAFSMCSVLTNAPLQTSLIKPLISQCGECNICKSVCKTDALKGISWNKKILRDERLNVSACNTCFQCLAHCKWTQTYVNEYCNEK